MPQPQQMQHGRMEIRYTHPPVHRRKTQLIRGTMHHTTPHTSARQPRHHRILVVITTGTSRIAVSSQL